MKRLNEMVFIKKKTKTPWIESSINTVGHNYLIDYLSPIKKQINVCPSDFKYNSLVAENKDVIYTFNNSISTFF